MFPIPTITEAFIDAVMLEMGWCRFTDKYPVVEGEKNADYLGPNAVAELKIFEEEALQKPEHQMAVSEIFREHLVGKDSIDLEIEQIPESLRPAFEWRIAKPFQTAIKQASKQLKESARVCGASGEKIMIAVNNGYSYLNAANFERVLVTRAKRDTKAISHIACVTVEYHQGSFDAYVLCSTKTHIINSESKWSLDDRFSTIVSEKFGNAMAIMMKDQMNPELWINPQEPVKTIRFTNNGVEYIRHAPGVPDSRLS